MVTQHRTSISRMAALVFSTLVSQQVLAEDSLELDDLLVTAGLQPLSINDVAETGQVPCRIAA